MSGPGSSNARAFGMDSRVEGSSPSPRPDILCFKNFDTFSRIYICESKMNAVSRAQLPFTISTLQTYIYIYIYVYMYICTYTYK